MKKIIALLTAVIMVALSLCACGNKAPAIDAFVGSWGSGNGKWTVTKDGDNKVKVDYESAWNDKDGRYGHGTGELKDGVLNVNMEYSNYRKGSVESEPAVISVGQCVDKVTPAANVAKDYMLVEGEGFLGNLDAGLSDDQLEVYSVEDMSDSSKYVLWSSPLINLAGPSSEYQIWYSDQLTLTKEDLEGMSKENLQAAANEIYARHGVIFADKNVQDSFENPNCSWYKGTVNQDEFDDSVLSEIEKNNLKTIQECIEAAE